MEEQILFENEILENLNKFYGLGTQCIETIKNYLEYVNFRTEGTIDDIGNYNIILNVPNRFAYTEELIHTIHKILIHYKVTEKTYSRINRNDLRNFDKISADVVVIDETPNLFMRSTSNFLKNYIQMSQDKVFIFVYTESLRTIPHTKDLQEMIECFSWKFDIKGDISQKEKPRYILDKLSKNKVKVSKTCSLVNELAKKELATIDNELLYLTVKCRANHRTTITNDFLKQIYRTQYIKDLKLYNKSAMQELQELIGIDEVKQQITKIINYVRVNKSREQLPMLHMCFLGKPGSGKTECAKLIARILKEENILNGNFINATRSDLVAGYVGQSALKTRDVLNKAKGGILFIDECYSLFSDSSRDFSYEVVAEIVKFMEEEKNTCIIFAGYTEPVEEFLKSNAGLTSRIQFKIYFPDYSPDELYLIFKKMCKDNNYKLENNIKPLLLKHFEQAKKQEDFGNARYVRTLLDKIKMDQAQRIVLDDSQDINLIKKCDIENVLAYLDKQPKEEKRVIGFAM